MEKPKVKVPAPESLIGMMVDGRYEISAKLGEGGIGAVFLARDRKMMNRAVVVKVLLENWLDDPEIRRKFEHEKEALSRLDHPGIVGILDAGHIPENVPYLVMPFAPGLTLEQILKDEPKPSLDFCADVIEAVAEALSVAHSRGILHRDIKPENIIVDRSQAEKPRVRLIDFGIARVYDSQVSPVTFVGRSIGTVWYVAPEQLLGAVEQTPAADIFSLAVMTYLMITGERPFNPKTVVEMAALHKEGPKLRPSQINNALSSDVDEILTKALHFDPQQRPNEASDFGRSLAAALRGLGKATSGPRTVENLPFTPTKPVTAPDPALTDAPDDDVNNVKTWVQAKDLSETKPSEPQDNKWVRVAVILGLLFVMAGAVTVAVMSWGRDSAANVTPRQAAESPQPATAPDPDVPRMGISFITQETADSPARELDVPGVQGVTFRTGNKTSIVVELSRNGYLYLFNEDDLGNGRFAYNLLFPNPDFKEGLIKVKAGERVTVGPLTFKDEPGIEIFWFIWMPNSLQDLEEARINAFKNARGRVTDTNRSAWLKQFLSSYKPDEKRIRSAENTTIVTGDGNSIIYRVELEHR